MLRALRVYIFCQESIHADLVPAQSGDALRRYGGLGKDATLEPPFAAGRYRTQRRSHERER